MLFETPLRLDLTVNFSQGVRENGYVRAATGLQIVSARVGCVKIGTKPAPWFFRQRRGSAKKGGPRRNLLRVAGRRVRCDERSLVSCRTERLRENRYADHFHLLPSERSGDSSPLLPTDLLQSDWAQGDVGRFPTLMKGGSRLGSGNLLHHLPQRALSATFGEVCEGYAKRSLHHNPSV